MVGFRHLIGDDHGQRARCQRAQPRDQGALGVRRRGFARADVEPLQLAQRRTSGLYDRLGVGRRAVARRGQQRAVVHAERPQPLAQLVALAIVADQAQRRHVEAERAQVRRHGAGGARLRDHLDDLVGLEAGFERALGQRGVDHQVAVEEEVADHQDVDAGKTIGELAEALFVHSCNA